MDFDTAWCPVCDKQIIPKRTFVPVAHDDKPSPLARRKNNLVAAPRVRTIIDQGPYPLYCSDECKAHDVLNKEHSENHAPTYPLYYKDANSSSSSSSSVESISSDADESSPTSEYFDDLVPARPVAAPRSKSFLSSTTTTQRHRSPRVTPSSLPNTSALRDVDLEAVHTSDLMSQFSLSFSRRSESRVSLFSPSSNGSWSPLATATPASPPRRERPLLAQGAEGKLLVPPAMFVRVPSATTLPNSRRGSSSSVGSAGSAFSSRSRTGSVASSVGSSRPGIRSPLGRYGSDDEDEFEDAVDDTIPASPALSHFDLRSGTYVPPKRPTFETRSYSCDNFKTVSKHKPTYQRGASQEKRQSYNPDGKRLFLFPTD